MIVYLNGQFTPVSEARISPFDRGFLFGDGVYEAIRYVGGHPLGMHEHVERMRKSLAAVHIDFDPVVLAGLSQELMVRNGHVDGAVYWQVTRGATAIRSHLPPDNIIPTVFGYAWALPPLDACMELREVRAVLVPDIRWKRCEIKSISLMANVLAKLDAAADDAFEAIMHRRGWITEGASTNVLVVREGRILTPPTSHPAVDDASILHGVTRRMLLNLDQRIEERPIPLEDLMSADEVLITASTMMMSAVVEIDGRPVGAGRRGPVGERLYAAFLEAIRATVAAAPPSGPGSTV